MNSEYAHYTNSKTAEHKKESKTKDNQTKANP
jgi:hypothetical protein